MIPKFGDRLIIIIEQGGIAERAFNTINETNIKELFNSLRNSGINWGDARSSIHRSAPGHPPCARIRHQHNLNHHLYCCYATAFACKHRITQRLLRGQSYFANIQAYFIVYLIQSRAITEVDPVLADCHATRRHNQWQSPISSALIIVFRHRYLVQLGDLVNAATARNIGAEGLRPEPFLRHRDQVDLGSSDLGAQILDPSQHGL